VGLNYGSSGWEAFRWENGSMVGLGDLPTGLGNWGSIAQGVSADGSVVVGRGSGPSGREAFRWENGSMVGLGDLSGGGFWSEARAVSADGSVVVGYGHGSSGQAAFLWDAANNMRNLQDVLVNEHGLASSLAGWVLHVASGISADGKTIVGWGQNPSGLVESWLVRLDPATAVVPVPAALPLMLTAFAGLGLVGWRRKALAG
jgi:probable HAF family extracellular repeat protein